MKKELINIIENVSRTSKIEFAVLLAFIEVETGGEGFDPSTGKIKIQFEPSWFKKRAPYAPSGLWSVNKVDVQSKEWLAFNDAFKKNPIGAMESTSIGLGQVMGFHWKRLGFSSVGAFWDDAKTGLEAQVWHIVKFIQTDSNLLTAIKAKNWTKIASIYNGSGFMEIARKYGRVPYDKAMETSYKKYSKLFVSH